MGTHVTMELEDHEMELEETFSSRFPPEIYFKILEFQFHIFLQNNTSSISYNISHFIKSNLVVNRTFYRCVVKLIYKYCCFKTPHTFDIFLNTLKHNNKLGEIVRVLDFQEFTSIGLGRTGKMNKEIQMVTSRTILECLSLTPNLLEFLASENIKDDLDSNLLNFLFNDMKYLKSVDFCGCSGEVFVENFNQIKFKQPNYNIENISFHDCTDLSPSILENILVNLPNLRKLDLSHTQITSTILNKIPKTVRLTHLSLAYCIQLTTRELINFFINHPSITCNELVWLNLQCDSSTSSILNNNQLTFLLKMFDCNFKYLNFGGLNLTISNLQIIKKKFVKLKSLAIANNEFDIETIIEFLQPPKAKNELEKNSSGAEIMDLDIEEYQQLKFIDLSKNPFINRWSVDNSNFLNCCPSLECFEFSINIINDITNIGGTISYYDEQTFEKPVWKTFDSGGRRGWLFKVDPIRNPDNLWQIGLVEYDIETGNKIINIIKQPEFLRLVNKKISLSKGILFDADETFGDLERGIYKYYGMKM